MHRPLLVGLLLFGLSAPTVWAQTTVLYDGALGSDPTSAGQGPWLTYYDNAPGTFYTFGASTTLDTTASNGISAGFSNHTPLPVALVNAAFPVLDRTVGFVVTVSGLQVTGAAAPSPPRAPFNIIALADDLLGVELGFAADRVFSQADAPLFGAAAESYIDPGLFASGHDFDLAISGSSYILYMDGASILSGPLKDYSAFAGVPNPYIIPNFLFFGDNTTSAGGTATFSGLAVTVPEPGSLLVGALGLVWLAGRRRARGR
jgi:hypothetical protein